MSVGCRPKISCDKKRLHTLSVMSRAVVPKSIEPWCKLSQGWAFLHVCVCLSKGISTWRGQISSVLPALTLFRSCAHVTKCIFVCVRVRRGVCFIYMIVCWSVQCRKKALCTSSLDTQCTHAQKTQKEKDITYIYIYIVLVTPRSWVRILLMKCILNAH